jgi:MFS family permease
LVTGGVTGVIWALVRGNEVGWGSAEIMSALGLGILMLVGFVAWERRAPEPMLPLRLFGNRTFTAANATGFLMTGSIFAAAFLVSQFLQFVLGYSPLATGLRLLPWTATPMVVAPLAGMLADRIGPRPVMMAGMLLQGGGFAWIALVVGVGMGYGVLILPFVIAGVGASMVLATSSTAALSAVDPAEMGKASGANSTLQRFGGAFGIAAATAVFAANGHLGTAAAFTAGFRPALALAAGLSIVGAITAVAVGGRRLVSVSPPQLEPGVEAAEVAAAG